MTQRRADALVMLAENELATDATPMRPALVVHAPVEVVTGFSDKCGAIAGGPAIPAGSAARFACDAHIDVAIPGEDGLIGVAEPTTYLPPWLRRAVLRRDSYTCAFTGCEMKHFVQPHHIDMRCVFGPTKLDNLITLCTTHHNLVHEGGWGVKLEGGEPVWIRPSGARYEPGPAPSEAAAHRDTAPRATETEADVWPSSGSPAHEKESLPGPHLRPTKMSYPEFIHMFVAQREMALALDEDVDRLAAALKSLV